jgi:hypothetical protein
MFFTYITSAQQFSFSDSLDLNSDAKVDVISLDEGPDSYDYILKINSSETVGAFDDGEPNGFQIVDINKWDKYKEIAVHTPGPSSDDVYNIYWYNGSEIVFMNRLSRWPTFLENGIVYVDGWRGFWTQRDKFVLNNKTRRLEQIPQYAYYVGIKVQVSTSFPIYRTRQLQDQVALLKDNTEIELLMCDLNNSDWQNQLYLIKSSSKLLGWAKLHDIFDNSSGFQLAD